MDALLLVDIQNDFLPGGTLAVPQGDWVVGVANRLMPRFELVVATKDWHPADHISFARNHPGRQPGDVVEVDGFAQVLWPVHCVQETPGAEFAAGLNVAGIHHVVEKGADPMIDSYGGFFDNERRRSTGLEDYLKQRGVRRVFIMGLATDYCVKFTALDAVDLGFETHLVLDGCRGVDLKPGDVERAVAEMKGSGVCVLHNIV